MEILVGGLRIADLELHGLTFLDGIADHDRTGLLVRSDQIADEKVSTGELGALFIHGDPDMEGPLRQGAFIHTELSEDGLQTMQGRSAAEFLNDIMLRLGHDKPVSDRATAL